MRMIDKEEVSTIYNSVLESKLRRKEAMYWWICLRGQQKYTIGKKYFPDRKHTSLTGREIEAMWVKEEFIPPKTRPRKSTIDDLKSSYGK